MKGDFLTNAFTRLRSSLRKAGLYGDDSDDALQEAFCRLWVKRASLREEQVDGLLAVSVRNIRIDSLRRIKSHPEKSLDDFDDIPVSNDEDVSSDQLYEKVGRLIESVLSPRDREILFLRDRDGWEFDEIAQRFGVSEANARMIVSRSRKVIRDIYRNHNNDAI